MKTTLSLLAACLLACLTATNAHAETLDALRARAEQGDAEAQYNLGTVYGRRRLAISNGKKTILPPNHEESARWYRRAADQGHTTAILELATMYEYGISDFAGGDLEVPDKWEVPDNWEPTVYSKVRLLMRGPAYEGVLQDAKEAADWYRRAAEQGYADAQFRLANKYESGNGVLEDFEEALHWYRRAAEQGYPPAQTNLAIMHAEGKGTPVDLVTAYAWTNVAALTNWGISRERPVKNRKALAQRMTQEQIAEAQRLSRTLMQYTEQ